MGNASSTVSDTVGPVLLANERGRRLFHVSGSLVPALYLVGLLTWTQIRICYAVGLTVGIVLETLRLYGELEWTLFDRLTREYEQDALAGYLLYVLSSATVAFAFEPQIAIPAILMLTLGDPISGLVGSGEFRRVKRPPALATMFLVCTAIAVPFVPDAPLAAVLASAVATVADGVKPVVRGYVIDDNLTIPPLAAAALLAGLELSVALA